MDFSQRYGPWAIVAGASEGLGAAFARGAAARGLNVALVARRQAELETVAEHLQTQYGVQTLPVVADLSDASIASVIEQAMGDRQPGLLIYNAGLSHIGPFLDTNLQDHLLAVQVNCQGPLILSHWLGQKLKNRGHGGIILMSSLSAFQGSARIANYAATKAYDLNLAEALWSEFADYGVDVMACVAGATLTPNYLASSPNTGTTFPPEMKPEDVVAQAFDRFGKRPSMIPGWGNRIAYTLMNRLMPRKTSVGLMGRTMKSMYDR